MGTFGKVRDREHHCPILVSLVLLHFYLTDPWFFHHRWYH